MGCTQGYRLQSAVYYKSQPRHGHIIPAKFIYVALPLYECCIHLLDVSGVAAQGASASAAASSQPSVNTAIKAEQDGEDQVTSQFIVSFLCQLGLPLPAGQCPLHSVYYYMLSAPDQTLFSPECEEVLCSRST